MDLTGFTYCILSALCIGGHQTLSRYSGLSPQWISVMVTVVASLVVTPRVLLGRSTPLPSAKSFLIGGSAGVLNGLNLAMYGILMGNRERWEISKIYPLVVSAAIIFTAVASRLVFNEAFTTNKIIGTFFVGIAIYFLYR